MCVCVGGGGNPCCCSCCCLRCSSTNAPPPRPLPAPPQLRCCPVLGGRWAGRPRAPLHRRRQRGGLHHAGVHGVQGGVCGGRQPLWCRRPGAAGKGDPQGGWGGWGGGRGGVAREHSTRARRPPLRPPPLPSPPPPQFESRYLDGLVGPYPAAASVYAARSPINALDRFTRPIAFFQGDEDKIVPPSQVRAARRQALLSLWGAAGQSSSPPQTHTPHTRAHRRS